MWEKNPTLDPLQEYQNTLVESFLKYFLLILLLRLLFVLDILVKTKDEAKADINAMLFSSFSDEGQKFWFCGVCNFSHKDKFRVFMHADSKHYEYGVNCDECGKKSSTLNALQEHKSRYHKFK